MLRQTIWQMRRRDFIASMTVAAINRPILAHSQDRTTRRIGYIGGQLTSDQSKRLHEAFRAGLAEHGWKEGQNIIVDYRWASGQVSKAKAYAQEMLNSGVELIVAPVAGAYDGAHQATVITPIVFCSHGDPIGLGHAKTLAQPGGNMTGLSFYQAELSEKKLDLLLQVAPAAKRIGVLWNAEQPVSRSTQISVAAALGRRSVNSIFIEIKNASDIARYVANVSNEVQALFVIGSPFTFSHSTVLAQLAIESKLPSIFPFVEDADNGALFVYAPDLADLYRRCGGYVDKILKGAKPADIPIEQPTKFLMILNLHTAAQIGVKIPESFVTMADKIID